MSRKKSQHTKQFKLDAVNYRKEHPDLTQMECAKNLGIGVSTLARWNPSSEIMTAISQFEDPVTRNPTKPRKSLVSNVSYAILRMRPMC
jgi:transposase